MNQASSHQGTFENHLCLQFPPGFLRLKEQKETKIVSVANKFRVCILVDLIRTSGDQSCSVALFTTISLEEGQLCRGGQPAFQRFCLSHNGPTANQGTLAAHDQWVTDTHTAPSRPQVVMVAQRHTRSPPSRRRCRCLGRMLSAGALKGVHIHLQRNLSGTGVGTPEFGLLWANCLETALYWLWWLAVLWKWPSSSQSSYHTSLAVSLHFDQPHFCCKSLFRDG